MDFDKTVREFVAKYPSLDEEYPVKELFSDFLRLEGLCFKGIGIAIVTKNKWKSVSKRNTVTLREFADIFTDRNPKDYKSAFEKILKHYGYSQQKK